MEDEKNEISGNSPGVASGSAQPTEAASRKPAKGEPKAPIKLLYDTWDADGNRCPAGTVVDLPLEAAKQLLAEGKGERADPLPGEK